MVSVRRPGLFPPPPVRNFLPHGSQGIPATAATGCQASKQYFNRQPPVDRRFKRGLEVPDPVQQLKQLTYIQDWFGVLQLGHSAHFCQKARAGELASNPFREPVLKDSQTQRRLGLCPPLC